MWPEATYQGRPPRAKPHCSLRPSNGLLYLIPGDTHLRGAAGALMAPRLTIRRPNFRGGGLPIYGREGPISLSQGINPHKVARKAAPRACSAHRTAHVLRTSQNLGGRAHTFPKPGTQLCPWLGILGPGGWATYPPGLARAGVLWPKNAGLVYRGP